MAKATKKQIKQWQKYLADERAEADTYRKLAAKRENEEKEILLELADAESRHKKYWLSLLGDEAKNTKTPSFRNKILGFLARNFGSVFVLALAQSAEARSPYSSEIDASDQMAADEKIHGEIIRSLAARGRSRLSGSFRAAIFGANDGLVSNLALVVAMAAAGTQTHFILFAGLAGLLAGALSMAAGEYISVKSQQELLQASHPDKEADQAIIHLDRATNELELVFRARGMNKKQAQDKTRQIFEDLPKNSAKGALESNTNKDDSEISSAEDIIGSAPKAAISSFCFFASGAIIPVIPFFFGLPVTTAMVISIILVGIALLITGSIVGILSGKSPLTRALRQLLVGYGAAAITYCLGLLFGVSGA